ncbi:hypothetical protein BDC45DRAFT_312712 [Circinella umbellata]|nr:hypothetical protein BDC45DRAFT_312712 [Circinella umbellata]
MEKELDFLRIPQSRIALGSPISKSSSLSADNTSTTNHSIFSSPPLYTEHDSPSTASSDLSDDPRHDNGRHLIAQNNKGYVVTVDPTIPLSSSSSSSIGITKKNKNTSSTAISSSEPVDWTMTVSNGNLVIQTNIRNHNELFTSLQKMVSTLEFQDKVPAIFSNNSSEPDPIGKALRFILWKRYGKSRYKSMARSHRLVLMAANSSKSNINTVDGSMVTLQLLNAYFNCQHLLSIQVHRLTFFTLFVYEERAEFSPAAMALCAVICMQPCRHVQMVIPSEQLTDYGRYYAERAQEILDDRFDEISLEIFITYTFLSLYKMRMSQVEEGIRYADIAERISHLLEKEYEIPTNNQDFAQCDTDYIGKASLFHRAIQALIRARMLGHIILHNEAEEQHEVEKKRRQFMDYAQLHAKVHGENIKVRPVAGDSEEEERYIRAFLHMQNLRLEAHKVVQSFQSNDVVNFVGMFGHQLEMVMRYWYKEILPSDFRLSTQLFDASLTEKEYFDILDGDCLGNPIPLVTTMRVYGEYLIMAKSYLPSTPASTTYGSRHHMNDSKNPHQIEKLLDLRKQIDFEGTDEEFIQMMFSALRVNPKDLRGSLADISVRTITCILRILRYIQQRTLPVCLHNPLLVNDSWEVLKRVGRIYLFEDKGPTKETMRLRELFESFYDLARQTAAKQPYDEELGTKVKMMEEDLSGELSLLVPYHAKDPDFSYYLNI